MSFQLFCITPTNHHPTASFQCANRIQHPKSLFVGSRKIHYCEGAMLITKDAIPATPILADIISPSLFSAPSVLHANGPMWQVTNKDAAA
ncbi:hypothetical protein PHISP_03287 [Aspergillus sp. HF37]|nr:hypothetical protein PHISP_03287 [Aspergillus sp. HF37]